MGTNPRRNLCFIFALHLFLFLFVYFKSCRLVHDLTAEIGCRRIFLVPGQAQDELPIYFRIAGVLDIVKDVPSTPVLTSANAALVSCSAAIPSRAMFMKSRFVSEDPYFGPRTTRYMDLSSYLESPSHQFPLVYPTYSF